MTHKDEVFERIVCNATNSELKEYRRRINREIRLSETAIKEGFELDK